MDPELAWRAMRRWYVFWSALGGLTYVVCFGLAIWQLTSAKRSGLDDAWLAFWGIVGVVAVASLCWLFPASWWVMHVRLRHSAAALRQATLAPDSAISPRVVNQPTPLEGDELSAAYGAFGPFAFPEVRLPWQLINKLRWVLLPGFQLLILDGSSLLLHTPDSVRMWLGAHPAVIVAFSVQTATWVVMLAAAAALLLISIRRRAAQRRDGIRLIADATELRSEPIPGYPAVAVPWREARAFYRTLPPVSPTIMEGTAFCLDTGTQAVTWWLTPDASPEERAAHERLCRLIVSKTGRPLRDATRAASDIARPTAAGRRGTRMRRWGTIAFVLAPLLAVILLALVALDMRIYQVQEFVTQVPAIERQTPLFRDPLTAPNGYWPVHPASATQGAYSFAEGAYKITGGPQDQSPEALTQRQYGDVAVEVTARQRGGSSFDGVGLVLRQNAAQTDEITFTISPDGTWTVTQYQANPSGGAPTCTFPFLARHSRFIHAGTDRANTLFVLMRGASYFFFVNGLYLGSYVDTAPHPLTSGYSGLYLVDSTTTGLFSNFAVYPAP